MEEKRKPGRPPEVKKGKSSWKPASVTDVTDKEPGYRYRWARKDDDNIATKLANGWEVVSKLTSDKTSLAEERFTDGRRLTSTHEKKDLILLRTTEEHALEINEYYNNETERRTMGLTAHLKKDIKEKGGNAPVHGEITISSRMGTQVIE